MILPLLCSFICCLPFKPDFTLARLGCGRGQDPAYPPHNDQFSPHAAPAKTPRVGCICLDWDALKHILFPDFKLDGSLYKQEVELISLILFSQYIFQEEHLK